MVEDDQHLEKEVHVATGCPLVEIHITDWPKPREKTQTLSHSVGLAEGTEAERF